jgi:hypothetical protein
VPVDFVEGFRVRARSRPVAATGGPPRVGSGPGGGIHWDDGPAGYLFYIMTQYRRNIFSPKTQQLAGLCSAAHLIGALSEPQMQRLSTLMWQSLDLGRPEGAASRFTATSGSMSLLPLPGFGS